MKLCITSQGDSTDSMVDERFGRCKYFIIFDTETGASKIIENEGRDEAKSAGVKAAQLAISNKVDVVFSGNIGETAMAVLKAANIKTITGISGKVSKVIEDYKNGI